MPADTLEIHGLTVHVEGSGPTLLLLHGWPDSAALWDATVAALRDGYRCVRFTLPGFDVDLPPRSMSVHQLTDLIAAVVDQVSPDQPVTLLLHDWGCLFGAAYARRYPERVARAVVTDVGDAGSPAHLHGLTLRQKALIGGYQLPLALLWLLGRRAPRPATALTRRIAGWLGCPTPAGRIGWQQNYPYAVQVLGSLGGRRGMARLDTVFDSVPVLFCYGRRKPFSFHSAHWLDVLEARRGCGVRGFDTGHWIMVDQPEAYHDAVRTWLDGVPA